MILAILPDVSKAESLLNSLSEADFDLREVSVVMRNIALRDKISKDMGPLKGLMPEAIQTALQQSGISEEGARRCADAVANDKVLVAMKVDARYEKAAREMFSDHAGELIKA